MPQLISEGFLLLLNMPEGFPPPPLLLCLPSYSLMSVPVFSPLPSVLLSLNFIPSVSFLLCWLKFSSSEAAVAATDRVLFAFGDHHVGVPSITHHVI